MARPGGGRAACQRAAAYWSGQTELTCWNPGGMVTMVMAMLAFVGGSHRTSVTDDEV